MNTDLYRKVEMMKDFGKFLKKHGLKDIKVCIKNLSFTLDVPSLDIRGEYLFFITEELHISKNEDQ